MATDRARAAQAKTDALLRSVAVEHEGALGELSAAILERLRQTVPEFFADDDVAYDMAAAVDANVARVQRLIANTPAEAMREALPVEAGDLLQSTIQHGIPLISLLEAYRSAQGLAADWWQDRLAPTAGPRLLAQATKTLNQLIVTYIGAAAGQIRASYETERQAHENSVDGRRAHLIRKLLAGEQLDPTAAARTLNHPLAGRHVALVLWRGDEPGSDDLLEVTLADLAAAVGGVRVLTTSARHRVYAWMSTMGRLDPAPLHAASTPAEVHVAVSSVHDDIDGFVRAHAEAVQTAGVAREHRSLPAGSVAVYEDFELVALLSRDPDARDRFVRRTLGSLVADTRGAQRTRTTLQAFLASGGSPSRAAERLGVHRNTVRHRLAAHEDLLAESRRLEVELALRIVAQLGARPDA
ncbi:hypothetical protein DSM112329_03866 [Paraconexibacter sp. AEG42_29]|uniref:PucR family transcriptional regulator n=1 Tax=Paraconexibacter sp. AEG42_29 TaxID=2997339 RepID=A0AAU7AZC2_9ACTN